MQIDAIARDFVAYYREVQRFFRAFAQDGDVDRRPFRALQQVSNVSRAHVVGRLAIYGNNDVSGTDTGPVRGGAYERRDDDDFVVARTDRHAHAVIFAALIFTQQRVSFGIKEIGMRIEHVQPARNGAVINGLVGADRLGVILLHYVVDRSELAQAVTHIGVATRSRPGVDLLSENHAQEATADQDENYQEESATRTTCHLLIFLRLGRRNAPNAASERSIAWRLRPKRALSATQSNP